MVYTEQFSFDLETRPPYNFELTVHKPAGWWWGTPYEVFEKGTLWSAIRVKETLFGLRLKSKSSKNSQKINCVIFSSAKHSAQGEQELKRILGRALSVDEDLTEFYSIAAKDDLLKEVVQDLKGMHSVAWPELFPALILALTLQMAPVKRSNEMMDMLIKNFGEIASFDKHKILYWPSSMKMASTSEQDLRDKAKLGYRAKSLQAIAQALNSGFPTMDKLYDMSKGDAKKILLNLYGIGDYSAEIVMPGMGFPLDVWSAKIFGILLNDKVPDNPRKAIPQLKNKAFKRWGKWTGYAFVYVLNSLPLISKKIGVDLTLF